MPVIVPVKAWADHRSGTTVYYIDGQPISGTGAVPLANLSGWSRGALIVGNATVWAAYVHPAAANRILTTDANDTIWSSNTLNIAGNSTINGSLVGSMTGGGTVATGGFTLTVPKTGTAATGTGTAGYVAEWVTDAYTLQASVLRVWSESAVDGTGVTLIPNGAGDVTQVATFIYAVSAVSAGDATGGTISLEPSESFNIYDDTIDTLTLAVAVDGSVTVQRTAGADTFNVKIFGVWL